MTHVTPPVWAEELMKTEKRGRPGKYGFRKLDLYGVVSISPEALAGKTLREIKLQLNVAKTQTGKAFKARQLEDGTIEVCRVE